jgi:2-polyprenyl-6-methoxyphenol hydroxylase-like FAD-dependent oxidoreductase
MKVLVVGGGIGGLATALSLHAAGINVAVFESVAKVDPLGLGINLQPNAVREFIELGLGAQLAATGIPTANLAYYNKFGQMIWKEPRGLAAGYNWPQYSIHRGELQMILLDAVRNRIGEKNILLNHHLTAFEDTGSAVTAYFADKSSGASLKAHGGDVLIGADGIQSTVRRQLYPNEGPPVFSGRIQWRGAVEADPFFDGKTQVMIGHREQRVIIYPMSSAATKRGKSLINWLALLGGQSVNDSRESWDRIAIKDRFFSQFQTWNFDWIRPADLIASTSAIWEYPEADRDPLPRWSFNRVTLLGDAAHPMRPIGSQAGSQAVIDARVLAYELANASNPIAGLESYENIRRPITNEIVFHNREYGPEIVMQMAEERAPNGFSNIDTIIPYAEREQIALSFKQLAGFDPKGLNARPSVNVDRVFPNKPNVG